MSGAGDRPGFGALRAEGGRQSPIRAVRADLYDLDQQRVAVVTIVTDERAPDVIMFEGEPFLRIKGRGDALAYDQARAFRADIFEDLRR